MKLKKFFKAFSEYDEGSNENPYVEMLLLVGVLFVFTLLMGCLFFMCWVVQG